MSDVEHEEGESRYPALRALREALLDIFWRDKFTRWYLISVHVWWVTVAFILLPHVPGPEWLLIPLGWLGQWLIGKVCNALQDWHESESTCDCPVCQEQRTGGSA